LPRIQQIYSPAFILQLAHRGNVSHNVYGDV